MMTCGIRPPLHAVWNRPEAQAKSRASHGARSSRRDGAHSRAMRSSGLLGVHRFGACRTGSILHATSARRGRPPTHEGEPVDRLVEARRCMSARRGPPEPRRCCRRLGQAAWCSSRSLSRTSVLVRPLTFFRRRAPEALKPTLTQGATGCSAAWLTRLPCAVTLKLRFVLNRQPFKAAGVLDHSTDSRKAGRRQTLRAHGDGTDVGVR